MCCDNPAIFHSPSHPLAEDGSSDGVANDPKLLLREVTTADIPILLRARGRSLQFGGAKHFDVALQELGWIEPDPKDPRHISVDPVAYITSKLAQQKAANEDTTETEAWIAKLKEAGYNFESRGSV